MSVEHSEIGGLLAVKHTSAAEFKDSIMVNIGLKGE